jgi:hypothetical protein
MTNVSFVVVAVFILFNLGLSLTVNDQKNEFRKYIFAAKKSASGFLRGVIDTGCKSFVKKSLKYNDADLWTFTSSSHGADEQIKIFTPPSSIDSDAIKRPVTQVDTPPAHFQTNDDRLDHKGGDHYEDFPYGSG